MADRLVIAISASEYNGSYNLMSLGINLHPILFLLTFNSFNEIIRSFPAMSQPQRCLSRRLSRWATVHPAHSCPTARSSAGAGTITASWAWGATPTRTAPQVLASGQVRASLPYLLSGPVKTRTSIGSSPETMCEVVADGYEGGATALSRDECRGSRSGSRGSIAVPAARGLSVLRDPPSPHPSHPHPPPPSPLPPPPPPAACSITGS